MTREIIKSRWDDRDAPVWLAQNVWEIVKNISRKLPWLMLVALVVGVVIWTRRDGDFPGFLAVGELVLQQRHIYADAPTGINTWPPLFSVVCVPLTLLANASPLLARAWWIILNYLLLWLILGLLTRLVYDRPLRWNDASQDVLTPWTIAVGIPFILTHRYIFSNFDHLQFNLVIFALTLSGLYLGSRRHVLVGGLCLGAAAALKVMPIVFVPYLLYRRQWRFGLATAATTLLMSLAPALLWGWARLFEYFDAWRQVLVVGWGVGKMNQSVFAMLDRLIGHGIVPFDVEMIDHLAASGTPLAAWLALAMLAVVGAAALAMFRGPWRLDRPAGLIEISIVFLVVALFGPLTWKAYLVVLLCPMMLLVRIERAADGDPLERRVVRVVLAVFFVLGSLATPGVIGKGLGGALEMLSITTWSSLLILGLLFWLRYRCGALGPSAATALAGDCGAVTNGCSPTSAASRESANCTPA
jgi:hypothetical protein